MLACSATLLQGTVSPLELTYYTVPFSSLALVPAIWFAEARNAVTSWQLLSTDADMMLAFLSSCAAASTYNVSANLLLQQTSPVWMNVLGQVRLVLLLTVSSFLLPSEMNILSQQTMAGVSLLILGVWSYAKSKSAAPIEQSTGETAGKNSKIEGPAKT